MSNIIDKIIKEFDGVLIDDYGWEHHKVDGKDYLDVTRSAKAANLFDLYFDTYGKGALQSIDYGKGTISPGQWGYVSSADTKKKKRR